MKVGIIGFGKTGRAVASVLLESKKTNLQWVIRQSKQLEQQSVADFLGIESDEPSHIFSKDEYSIVALLDRYPVDIIVDFSSENGLDYYAEEAAKRGITIISAVSQYPEQRIQQLKQLATQTCVLHSPNITLGINFVILAAKILKNIAPETDIDVIEEHFKAKPEVSGTAKVITRELVCLKTALNQYVQVGLWGCMKFYSVFHFKRCDSNTNPSPVKLLATVFYLLLKI